MGHKKTPYLIRNKRWIVTDNFVRNDLSKQRLIKAVTILA